MKDHNVTVYSTQTCHFCGLAKDYLKGKGVKYTEVDVGADINKAREMVAKSGQMGVPVIEIDGQIIVGYQPETFDRLLA